MKEKFKSRKFILAQILIAGMFVLRVLNCIDNDNFAHAVIALFGVYCGANVTSKFVK